MPKTLPRDNFDVAIIGAGIIGCSTAYYAAKAGLRVVLVDKGAVGFEQSTRNWGWVHQQVRYPHLIEFAMYSRRLWEGLTSELGCDLEWRRGGHLSLASDAADMAAFALYQREAAPSGLDVQLLDPAETAVLLPGIGNAVVGALHIESDGQANPRLATRAFANAAEAAGALVLEGCATNAIACSDNTVHGIDTEWGSIAAQQVVVACGAWSRRLLQPLGIKLPQNAIRSTVIRTTPAPAYTAATGWAKAVAFRQDTKGRFVLAAGNKSTFDVNLDALTDWQTFGPAALHYRTRLKIRLGKPLLRDIARLIPGTAAHKAPWAQLRTNEPPADLTAAAPNLAGFHELLPRFADLAVERIWAGNIDMTPDQAPVLDSRTGIGGLVIATGFSGHGFAMGPGGGHAAARLVQGETPEVDLHGFRLCRFAEHDLGPLPDFHP